MLHDRGERLSLMEREDAESVKEYLEALKGYFEQYTPGKTKREGRALLQQLEEKLRNGDDREDNEADMAYRVLAQHRMANGSFLVATVQECGLSERDVLWSEYVRALSGTR